METYEEKAKKWQQIRDKNIDLNIISNGCVRLYHKESIMDYDIELLKDKNYEIIEFEGDFLSNKAELHYDLQHKLNFPDYYGKNFDALNDCLEPVRVFIFSFF
ncbi:barstar family protein [Bernardetia sp. Wsw4-3y2]|uniref:barstar family protein n=1 Tax=Bernardetia sp. Wsw4-3y2 TaxID=3127471 RepID=UPI0030D13A70